MHVCVTECAGFLCFCTNYYLNKQNNHKNSATILALAITKCYIPACLERLAIQTVSTGCSHCALRCLWPRGYWQSTCRACRTEQPGRGWRWMSGRHWPSAEHGRATVAKNCESRQGQNAVRPARQWHVHDAYYSSRATSMMSSHQCDKSCPDGSQTSLTLN